MNDYAFEAHGLTKRFGDTQALAGIDLAATEGTVLGVLGPNGAGKTTAVRILATLLRPDSGTAVVAGYDVLKNPTQVRANIGLTLVDGEQGGEHPDHGGLAGAVGAEYAEDLAAAHFEVDAVDGAEVAEGLDEPGGADREVACGVGGSGHGSTVGPRGFTAPSHRFHRLRIV